MKRISVVYIIAKQVDFFQLQLLYKYFYFLPFTNSSKVLFDRFTMISIIVV